MAPELLVSLHQQIRICKYRALGHVQRFLRLDGKRPIWCWKCARNRSALTLVQRDGGEKSKGLVDDSFHWTMISSQVFVRKVDLLTILQFLDSFICWGTITANIIDFFP